MDLVKYLTDIYGYDTPIFLKDIRIGRKSKTAIREEFYRATKKGTIERKTNGVYFLRSKKEFGSGVTFTDILDKKYIFPVETLPGLEFMFVEGYYSGLTFLNKIGLSQQVPAILEITTNKTSSKKRYFSIGRNIAIIRKGKTTINYQNYKILQFLDMFHFVSMNEVKDNKKLLTDYVIKNQFSKNQLNQYLKLYGTDTIKKIVEGGIINAFM